MLSISDLANNNGNENINFSNFFKNIIERKLIDWIRLEADPILYAEHLYASLHQLDASDTDCILGEMPPQNPEWLAVLDRLKRASSLPHQHYSK